MKKNQYSKREGESITKTTLNLACFKEVCAGYTPGLDTLSYFLYHSIVTASHSSVRKGNSLQISWTVKKEMWRNQRKKLNKKGASLFIAESEVL